MRGGALGSGLLCGDLTLPPPLCAGARARVGACARVCAGMGACALAWGYARSVVGLGMIVWALAFRPGIHIRVHDRMPRGMAEKFFMRFYLLECPNGQKSFENRLHVRTD